MKFEAISQVTILKVGLLSNFITKFNLSKVVNIMAITRTILASGDFKHTLKYVDALS